ncbi:PREDICTED: acid-sensing ion channel 5-like [Amphimedon queenslandica]|uniref:Uncharacterized protein n=1 Tax=Amphimedon queenslandica TaxID=400682 RepID=A0AAN0IL53_AMPQE|nr:PREDICTED: acid-sensing ion channel 5-like [Amphimedon queenslandica]|eukprot:XP_011403357.2 PREDICTED: acid-sensing ion channel 5-like [Amphimedon queenslandica]
MDVQESRAGSSSHNFDQADQPDADETIDEDKVNILDPSPQKKSFKLRLKRGQHHFNKWLDNTSIHGIVHVFKGRSRLRRILWLLVFLFASTTCAGIIIFYIVLWAQDPTSTSISFITDDEGQSFPAVTVCNLNAVKKDYADQYVVDLLNNYANPTSGFIQNWPFSNISRSCTDSLNSITIEDQQEKLFDAYTNGGNKIDDFVVYCGFAGSDGNIVRCEESLEPVFTSLGVCFTFNSAYNGQPDRKVTLAGPQFGLNLVLNVSVSEYLRLGSSNVGVKVSVHDRNSMPVPQVGVTLSPGTNSYLAIETVKHVDKTRESNCVRHNRSLAFFPGYSYAASTCRINAEYRNYADANKCGCSPEVNPSSNVNTRNCTIADICCLSQERRTFNPSTNCPLSCDHLTYNVEQSYSKLFSSASSESAAESLGKTVEASLLSVYIHFDDILITQLLTRYSYTIANLIADMGSLFGLLLMNLLIVSIMRRAVKKLESKIMALPEVNLDGPIDDA